MTQPKFRAWHKEREQMCAVAGLWHLNTSRMLIEIIVENWLDYSGMYFRNRIFCNSGEVELMQWSQCVDINGVDIYKDDIVKIQGSLFQVLGKGGNFCIATKPSYNVIKEELLCLFDAEVVGNIYEHPHLLKKEHAKDGASIPPV